MEYILYENISGYYLFSITQQERIIDSEAYENLGKLSQIIQLKSKYIFSCINEAYESYETLKNNSLPEKLLVFLEVNKITVLHCDKSLFINLNNLGIRTKYSPLIMKGIKANEDRLLTEELNKSFKIAAQKFISQKSSNYQLTNDSYLIKQYYTFLISKNNQINKTFQTIKKLFLFYFPEFKERKQKEFIKKVKILGDFKINNLEILKKKSIEVNIPLKELQETLGITVDWSLIEKQLEIFQCQFEDLQNTENILNTKIKRIFPNSVKIISFKNLASLLSKIGYDNIPFLNIEKFKKLCPEPEIRINKKLKVSYLNFYYSLSLKILRLEYYGALTNNLTNNFIESIHKRYKKSKRIEKREGNLENRILKKLEVLNN